MEKLMKASQLAKYLDCNVETIYRMVKRGEIPCYRKGQLLRFKRKEVDEAMKGGKNAKKDGTRRNSNLATQ